MGSNASTTNLSLDQRRLEIADCHQLNHALPEECWQALREDASRCFGERNRVIVGDCIGLIDNPAIRPTGARNNPFHLPVETGAGPNLCSSA
jgi:hypothetical protein